MVDNVPAVVAVVALPAKFAVIVPALKLPLASLFTIVFAVFDDVAEFTDDATAVIVDEFTPPTEFTVGDVAVPPKFPANCIKPFVVVDASGDPLGLSVVHVNVPDPVELNT